MYKIGFDARMANHTGIGTYVRGLVDGFLSVQDEIDLALFGTDKEMSGRWKRYPSRSFYRPIYSISEQLLYPFMLSRTRLWHAPHYNIPLLKPPHTRLVVTIHDLIHWVFRNEILSPLQVFYVKTMFEKVAVLADRIITVSESTKNDLMNFFSVREDKISVIYEGYDASFCRSDDSQIARIAGKFGISRPYFLYVGLMKPHKQIPWLIENYLHLRKAKKIDAQLVIVGQGDPSYMSKHAQFRELSGHPDIIHVETVERNDLAPLYSGALALVHPSSYEGFGLTLLEAMACRTAVIACRVASIPEVAGDAALLVDPQAGEQLQEAMIHLERDEGLRMGLIHRGLRQLQKFNWQRTAEKTLEVYRHVLGEKSLKK